MKTSCLSRREFLQFACASLGAIALPSGKYKHLRPKIRPPLVNLEDLPPAIREVFDSLAEININYHGMAYSMHRFKHRLDAKPLPVDQTQWNINHRSPADLLEISIPWGIVLHWFGDRDQELDQSGYIRGFDGLRHIYGNVPFPPGMSRQKREYYEFMDSLQANLKTNSDQYYNTSAHFLIGSENPTSPDAFSGKRVGIVQTQTPNEQGIPYRAAHVGPPDYQTENYFLQVLAKLPVQSQGKPSLLQELFSNPSIHPNQRTIGVEISGYNFDDPGHFPDNQKVANVLSIVWALMKRYSISANNLLGHHEIQLGKADPGKEFMAMMRCLVGLKALMDPDPDMYALVYGQYINSLEEYANEPEKYLETVRNYLLMSSDPEVVYHWEGVSNYWLIQSVISRKNEIAPKNLRIMMPIDENFLTPGMKYLDPPNHEGIDLYPESFIKNSSRLELKKTIRLVADGECIYFGKGSGHHSGLMAIFSHIQLDGAKFLSIYCNLDALNDLRIGQRYPSGISLGEIWAKGSSKSAYLHFAIAYGATWETDLKDRPVPPLNCGPTWISKRYIDPIVYLNKSIK